MTSDLAGLPYPEGSPGGLESAAGRLAALAAAVTADAADARAAARPPSWVGPAAAAFGVIASAVATRLTASADALHAAASPVRRLAHTLEDAQRDVRAYAREVEAAEQAVRRAQGHAQSVRAGAAPPLMGGNPLAASPFDAEVREAERLVGQAQQHVDDLRTRYRAKAQHLCDAVDRADQAAADAVLSAVDAAPSGTSAVPGAPHVPGPVRMFAPVFLFHPDERYLPADAEKDLREHFPLPHGPRSVDPHGLPFAPRFPGDVKALAGVGAGAPIYYRVRHTPGGGSVVEYWVYHRNNDFRNKNMNGALEGTHRGDWESVAVRLDRFDKPQQVGYSQHDGGCSLPYADAVKRRGHPTAYEALGSGASYPRPGAYDNAVRKVLGVHLPIDVNPVDDLASGQGTGKRIVHSADNLVDYDHTPLRGYDGQYGADKHSPEGPHRQTGKFSVTSDTWRTPCPDPVKAGG